MASILTDKENEPLPELPIFYRLFDIAYGGLDLDLAIGMPTKLEEKFETIYCIGEAGVFIDYSIEDMDEKTELSNVVRGSEEYRAIKKEYINKRKIKRNIVLGEVEHTVSVMTAGKNFNNYNAYQAMKLLTEALELVEFTDPILRTFWEPDSVDPSDVDLSFHPRRL